VHAGANHGYSLPDRDVYDRNAAETDWREIFAMFERQLAHSA
jgi:carboxymethylenebutenolidase